MGQRLIVNQEEKENIQKMYEQMTGVAFGGEMNGFKKKVETPSEEVKVQNCVTSIWRPSSISNSARSGKSKLAYCGLRPYWVRLIIFALPPTRTLVEPFSPTGTTLNPTEVPVYRYGSVIVVDSGSVSPSTNTNTLIAP